MICLSSEILFSVSSIPEAFNCSFYFINWIFFSSDVSVCFYSCNIYLCWNSHSDNELLFWLHWNVCLYSFVSHWVSLRSLIWKFSDILLISFFLESATRDLLCLSGGEMSCFLGSSYFLCPYVPTLICASCGIVSFSKLWINCHRDRLLPVDTF